MLRIAVGLSVLLIAGVVIGYGLSWIMQRPQLRQEQIMPVVEEEVAPPRTFYLYFAAQNGTHLVSERREMASCKTDQECIGALLRELIAGPRIPENLPVLPRQTEVLDVRLEESLATIDFSRQLVDYHPGGSLAELLTLYSLSNTLSENFPYLRQVQILVEGQTRETLRGHARIDQPVVADFTFNQPPAPGPQGTSAEPAPAGLSIEGVIEEAVDN